MKARQLGIISGVLSSICCLGPLVLIALGLGGLGFAAVVGKFHWWFIAAGLILLLLGWRSYLSEKKSCESKSCEFKGGRITLTILSLATLALFTFSGMNIYAQMKPASLMVSISNMSSIVIPVEGMTCFTCEIAVQNAVRGLDGIHEVDADVKNKVAHVSFDETKVNISDIVDAINTTGFEASRSEVTSGN